jgi:DNA-binding transcriptional LysR family regulator
MTLDQIRNFIALAEFQSFTKAAERAYITQPSLSRSIASLESSLGIRLLDRDTRYVTLTEAGKILYAEGNRILDDLYYLENRLKDMALGITGVLSILAPDFYYGPFSERCQLFSQDYPLVNLEISAERSWQIPECILMRKADIGLTFQHEVETDELESVKLGSDQLCVLVPKGHPLAGKEKVSLGELQTDEILFFGDSSVKNSGCGALIPELQEDLKTPAEHHIISSLDTALQRMYAGQGIVVLPACVGSVRSHRTNCRMLMLDIPGMALDVVLVYRKDNTNPSVSNFINLSLDGPRK